MSANNHIIDNDRNENDNFDQKRQKTYDYNKSLRQPHNMIWSEKADFIALSFRYRLLSILLQEQHMFVLMRAAGFEGQKRFYIH